MNDVQAFSRLANDASFSLKTTHHTNLDSMWSHVLLAECQSEWKVSKKSSVSGIQRVELESEFELELELELDFGFNIISALPTWMSN